MTRKTEIAITKEGEQTPQLPPFIIDDNQYELTNKKNPLWEAVLGLGAGWGLAVALGTIVELFIDIRKPSGTPHRFKNLVQSDNNWRQALDAAGMATGAGIMAAKAMKHNKDIKTYSDKIKSEKEQQTLAPQQTR